MLFRLARLLLAMTLWVGPLLAIGAGPAQSGEPPAGPQGAALYAQMDNGAGGGVQSQLTPDQPQITNLAADDFLVPASTGQWVISAVVVDGSYVGSATISSATVRFYANDRNTNLPGTQLYTATVPSGSIGNVASGDLSIPLPAALTLAPGTYWVSVQATKNVQSPPNPGVWYWTERSVQSNSASAWRNPSGFSGCANWAPRVATCNQGSFPDLLFQLDGTASNQNPVPQLTLLAPNASGPGQSLLLTLYGVNFVSGAEVRWNGSARTTTFVDSTTLTALIPASDLTTPGTTVNVKVFNPGPGGGESNALTFTVTTYRLFVPFVRRS